MEKSTNIDYTMRDFSSKTKYILFDELIAAQRKKGFLLREDFETAFNYRRNDAEIVLKGFWKAGIIYKIKEPGTYKFRISKFCFNRGECL